MNLIGKILVVLNFVAAVSFMMLALAVHATHVNWRSEVTRTPDQAAQENKDIGLQEQLAQADARLKAAQAESDRLQLALSQENQELQQQIAKLDSFLNKTVTELEKLQDEELKLRTDTSEAVKKMETAQLQHTAIQQELKDLRTLNQNTQKDRDVQFDIALKLTNQLAQQTFDYQLRKTRNEQLMAQIRDLRLVIQDAGLRLKPGDKPTVEGIVLASADNGLIEISLGSDDGLVKGDTLEVYRAGSANGASQYLGRVRIVKLDSFKAVAQVVPELRQGKIQKGDRVATRLT